MSGSKNNSKGPDMNWIQIDAIIWSMVKAWNGSDSGKEEILTAITKKFRWNEKQAKIACESHFNMYNKLKTK